MKKKLESRYDKLSGEVKIGLNVNERTKNEMSKNNKETERKNQHIPTDQLSGEVRTGLNTNTATGNDLKDMEKTGQKPKADLSQEINDNRQKEEIPNDKLSGEQNTGQRNNVPTKSNPKGKDNI